MLYFLLGDFEYEMLSLTDIRRSVCEFDPGYTGAMNLYVPPASASSEQIREIKHQLLQDIIIPVIIRPRKHALLMMKEGFDLVPISSHLKLFTPHELTLELVADENYTFDDLSPNIVYIFPEDFPPREADMFQRMFNEAMSNLEDEHISLLLRFVTGSALLKCHGESPTRVEIRPREVTGDTKGYPRWPLLKSYTCFSQLFVPYLPKNKRIMNGSNIWTVGNMSENIVKSLEHMGQFCDVPDVV